VTLFRMRQSPEMPHRLSSGDDGDADNNDSDDDNGDDDNGDDDNGSDDVASRQQFNASRDSHRC
jgi:hypothetical protein